jgi:hypothetical protein
MAETEESKRLIRLTDLLGQCLAGLVISLAGVLLIDGIYALLGFGEFGKVSGWLAMVFPILVFAQQFTAARGEPGRVLAAIVGVLVAAALGLPAAGLAGGLPPIASGAIGALFATLAYATVWHVGLAVAAGKRP